MKHRFNTDEAIPAKTGLAHHSITKEIIGAAFEVYKGLGYGFLERVYQNALQVELLKRGINAVTEHRIKVWYKEVVVGDYSADLLVDDKVVVEVKVCSEYNPQDEPQLLNELKGSGMKVGLLVNFGRTKVEFKRFVY